MKNFQREKVKESFFYCSFPYGAVFISTEEGRKIPSSLLSIKLNQNKKSFQRNCKRFNVETVELGVRSFVCMRAHFPRD